MLRQMWGRRTIKNLLKELESYWKVEPKEVKVLYNFGNREDSILSRWEPEELPLKLPVPSGKAKYMKRPIVNQYRE